MFPLYTASELLKAKKEHNKPSLKPPKEQSKTPVEKSRVRFVFGKARGGSARMEGHLFEDVVNGEKKKKKHPKFRMTSANKVEHSNQFMQLRSNVTNFI